MKLSVRTSIQDIVHRYRTTHVNLKKETLIQNNLRITKCYETNIFLNILTKINKTKYYETNTSKKIKKMYMNCTENKILVIKIVRVNMSRFRYIVFTR
jgi:hypothetical protein